MPMAKKKRLVRKEPEEEYEFVPPEFDEREFILKDIYGTKILVAVTVLAVVIGALAACIDIAWAWYGGLLLLLVVAVALKPFLVKIGLEADRIDAKGMVGNYVLFLLLALGVWILCTNPPFQALGL